MSQLFNILSDINQENIEKIKKFITAIEKVYTNKTLDDINVDGIIVDYLNDYIINSDDEINISISHDFIENIKNISKVMIENCQCKIADIFKIILKKYKKKYQNYLAGKSTQEARDIIKTNYLNLKEIISSIAIVKIAKIIL